MSLQPKYIADIDKCCCDLDTICNGRNITTTKIQ